jgi:hypothetical protein
MSSEKPLDKFLSKKTPQQMPASDAGAGTDEQDYRAYGINRTGRPALMLDLRLVSGNYLALSYSYLMSAAFNLSGELSLLFTSHQVTVKGKNLRRIYDGVLSHTLRYIQEENADYERDNPEPFISEIAIDETLAL